ncbi:CASP-like protein 5B2 [Punica granatum]|nr:CASP-like protein 5B2 [Punica granatum]XP_031403535.1 CASP-like protein 5B2 [Punica granatum]XP_031403537.1 CASP-like protein 5B2 [Punica granatum]OWM62833.1 hypothetical protein CDL15_Pgr020127 [Punica granatum]
MQMVVSEVYQEKKDRQMVNIVGGPGTRIGLSFRVGQLVFAAASLYVMVGAKEYKKFIPYSYLVYANGFIILWSFISACLDKYALRQQLDLQGLAAIRFIVPVNLVAWFLSVTAASSSSGILTYIVYDFPVCSVEDLPCFEYGIAVIFAWLSTVCLSFSANATVVILYKKLA